MNAFQILDKEGKSISINLLDEQICNLIGAPVDKKNYCKLGKREDYPANQKGEIDFCFNTYNWYDTFGWMIASDNQSFEDIIEQYTKPMEKYIGEIDEDGSIITIETIYPYHMKVLNFWINEGYTHKQILSEQNQLKLEAEQASQETLEYLEQ